MALLAETFTVFLLQQENKQLLNGKKHVRSTFIPHKFLSWLRICLLCKIN